MITPLLAPRAGVPEVITSTSKFEEMINQLLDGEGSIAIDAERASGYRYSQRAYLIQIFRKNGGLHLIDPIPFIDSDLWQKFNSSFSKYEWVIHASTQDLPCLLELGLDPQILFDTELGARIAGCPRVGLGPLSESLLELQLAKEHSAVDWSIRPLKAEWLTYAALDVDVLLDIRQKVEALLIEKNKLDWAKQDFASILKNFKAKQVQPEKPDRWRRTSGMHKVRDRLNMTIIRDLWLSRNQLAQELDLAPGRVLGDEAIVEIAIKRPTTAEEMAKVISWRTKLDPPPFKRWLDVLNKSLQTPLADQVELRLPSQGLPPIKIWKDKNPLGYARLTHARGKIAALSSEIEIPAENLITPELVRKICWELPNVEQSEYEKFVTSELSNLGARPWQINQVAPLIASALLEKEPLIIPEPDSVEEADQPASEPVQE